MIRDKFRNFAAILTAHLLALYGSAGVLAEEAWWSGEMSGWSSEWKRTALAQAETYGNPTGSNLDFGLQTDSDLPLLLADASGEAEGGGEPKSTDCARFESDIDADIGEIIRAGCKPTTAQMSALMDNPLGNVAMLFSWMQ